MRFTVMRSKAVSCLICDKQYQSPLENYMSTTHQWDFKMQCFECQYTGFCRLLSAQNMVRVNDGKIIWK